MLLDGNWQLFFAENKAVEKIDEFCTIEKLQNSNFNKVNAIVPGNFEIDLQREGIIEDPFWSDNIQFALERENYHLWYVREFVVQDTENYEFLFEGIDTFADVYLNGILIGSCDNMLISYKFDANGLIKGNNQIVVHIKPTFLKARKTEIGAGVINHLDYNAESLVVRKAAHMYGWDIMPRMLSGGIWRSVKLKKKVINGIKETYLRTVELKENNAIMRFYYNTCLSEDFTHKYSLSIIGKCKDSQFCKNLRLWNNSGTVDFSIESPYLWWTKNMGEANLYDVSVKLLYNNEVVDEKTFQLGIRTFKLNRTSLADDGEFCFILNDKKLFVMGTNWVALDALHSRDKQRLPQALELLNDSGCNMVRCWGGNVYEDESFYEFCDQNGIAVWQDFGMGCATYPLSREMHATLENEITQIVKKYRQHTCLAIWAGDNECDEAAVFWEENGLDPNRNLLTRKLIPWVLNLHDPERAYIPSSPYVDKVAYDSGDGGNTPEKHLWGPRDYFKSDFYTKANAKFASETGYHGCPAPSSIKKFISNDKLWPWKDNDEWQLHATCVELGEDARYAFRIPLMANQVKVLFNEIPDDIERFSKMSQSSQAEADKFFVERFRTAKWDRTGIIWWNLLDGWPQFSDAVVDYYYSKKLAYYVLKRSQQPICIMMREPENGQLEVVCANEYLTGYEIVYKINDLTEKKCVCSGIANISPNSSQTITTIPYKGEKMHFYVMEWEYDSEKGSNYYVSGQAPYDFDEYYNLMCESGMWETDGF